MEDPTRPDFHSAGDATENSELMSLVELQKFLADELASTESESSFTRAFLPLTDGLGLESPRRPSVYAPPKTVIPGKSAPPETSRPEPKKPILPPPPEFQAKVSSAHPNVSSAHPATQKELASIINEEAARELSATKEPKINSQKVLKDAVGRKEIAPLKPRPAMDSDELPPVDPLIARKVQPIVPKEEEVIAEKVPLAVPPPMPTASWFRRAQAAIVDQVFVLSFWAGALVITSNSLARTQGPLLTQLAHDFSDVVFLRYAALEFVAVWLCYLAFCIGIMGRTVGMWVWGLRVAYGNKRRFLKKVGRIVFSAVFLAPILPTLLLTIRIRGRNLLDFFSGTSLYRTVG